VRTAPIRRAAERAEETLLIEWPEGEAEPTKYWLSTLDKNVSYRLRLIDSWDFLGFTTGIEAVSFRRHDSVGGQGS
jgi:hypothetical protein